MTDFLKCLLMNSVSHNASSSKAALLKSSLYMYCLIIQYYILLVQLLYIFQKVAPGQENTHKLHWCIRHILLSLPELM